MAVRVLRSRRSRRDVLNHAITIAESNPDAARRFLAVVEASVEQLAAHPRIGSPRRFLNTALERLRTWPVRGFANHLVFYRPEGDRVRVVRVQHGAQLIEDILSLEP